MECIHLINELQMGLDYMDVWGDVPLRRSFKSAITALSGSKGQDSKLCILYEQELNLSACYKLHLRDGGENRGHRFQTIA